MENATADRVLKRKGTVLSPTTNWDASRGTTAENSQWIVSAGATNDDAVDFGQHTLTPISASAFVDGFEDFDVGNVTSLEVTGLDAETEYSYVVRATSVTSTSANSDVRTVTTKGITLISVNSGTTSLTYSGAAQGPTFTVTGSAGAVTYSYAGTGATTYGPTATAPTNVGTYTVTATAAADTNFDGAASAATAFTIAKATPSITAASGSVGLTTGGGGPAGSVVVESVVGGTSVEPVATGTVESTLVPTLTLVEVTNVGVVATTSEARSIDLLRSNSPAPTLTTTSRAPRPSVRLLRVARWRE